MIRHVTFGYLISMMSSCLIVQSYKPLPKFYHSPICFTKITRHTMLHTKCRICDNSLTGIGLRCVNHGISPITAIIEYYF